jgi:multiple sugar transport system ATP-binding protein
MRSELKQIAQTSSTTTVYVTHDYQEALALGDRVAVLRKGRFVQVGAPEEVWRQPVDTFVAKSLGQPEINLLDARFERGEVVFAGGAGRFPAPTELQLAEGQRLRLGLRPSELEVDRGHRTGASGEWLQVPGRVLLAERLGRQVELDVRVGDQQLIVVEDSDHAPAEGEEVTVQIHLPNVHIFDSGEDGEDSLRLGSAIGRHSAALPEEAHR